MYLLGAFIFARKHLIAATVDKSATHVLPQSPKERYTVKTKTLISDWTIALISYLCRNNQLLVSESDRNFFLYNT